MESIYAPQGDENVWNFADFQTTENQSMPRKGTKTRNQTAVIAVAVTNQSMPRKGTKTFNSCSSSIALMESIYAPQGDENQLGMTIAYTV